MVYVLAYAQKDKQNCQHCYQKTHCHWSLIVDLTRSLFVAFYGNIFSHGNYSFDEKLCLGTKERKVISIFSWKINSILLLFNCCWEQKRKSIVIESAFKLRTEGGVFEVLTNISIQYFMRKILRISPLHHTSNCWCRKIS